MNARHKVMALAAVIVVPLLLFSLGVTGSYSQSVQPQLAPLNPAFVRYQEKVKAGTFQAYDLEGNPLGYIPPPMDMSHLKRIAALQAVPPPLGLPTSFDWRTSRGFNGVTPVKDQGACGSCWTFGNLGALEARYRINDVAHHVIDLSENNMASCHWPWLWTRCAGGNTWVAGSYLVGLYWYKPASISYPQQKGAVSEASDPYSDSSHNDTLCGNTGTGRPNPLLRVNGFRWVANDKTQMKNAIFIESPITTAFYWDPAHYNPTTYVYYYPNCTEDTNHEVLLVGWDDNKAWPGSAGKGCWIVKNSWDTTWGNAGYFYIAYGSGKVGDDNLYYDYWRYRNPNERLYVEDLPGMVDAAGTGAATYAWGALVFTPVEAETLTHVEIYTTSPATSYIIYVYNTATESGSQATFSGLKGSQTGSCNEMGYYAIKLNSPLDLTAGKKYGVVVKFTTPSYYFPLPIAYVVAGVIADFFSKASGKTYAKFASGDPFSRVVIGPTTCAVSIRARTTK